METTYLRAPKAAVRTPDNNVGAEVRRFESGGEWADDGSLGGWRGVGHGRRTLRSCVVDSRLERKMRLDEVKELPTEGTQILLLWKAEVYVFSRRHKVGRFGLSLNCKCPRSQPCTSIVLDRANHEHSKVCRKDLLRSRRLATRWNVYFEQVKATLLGGLPALGDHGLSTCELC